MEDFEHGLALSLVDLREGGLDYFAVIGAAVVQELGEPEGRVTEKDLGIFKALVIVSHAEVELLGHVLDLLEKIGGLIRFPSGVLLHAELSHLVDELGIEKGLFTRLSGGDARLKGRNSLLVDDLFVGMRCAGRDSDGCEGEDRDGAS